LLSPDRFHDENGSCARDTTAAWLAKLKDDEKKKVQTAANELREALTGDDIEAIEKKTEAVITAMQGVSTRLYQEAAEKAAKEGAQAGGPGPGTGATGPGGESGGMVAADCSRKAHPCCAIIFLLGCIVNPFRTIGMMTTGTEVCFRAGYTLVAVPLSAL
jgi:hypothetical protein